MKKLVLLFAALLVAGCGEKSSDSVTLPLSDADVERLLKEAVDVDSLEERGDLRYQANESEPYSGWAKGMYDSGQVQMLVQLKDGKHDGLGTVWHRNGQKRDEKTYKDDNLDGLWTYWYKNGQKQREATWKDGKPDGLRTAWHENGQKESEATFKDGKMDGSRRAWHENGQKKVEEIYKDGEVVSEKFWNSKGEEVETYQESQK